MHEYVLIQTTVAARQDADRIAATLVEKRLAACVQIIGPVTSTFHWQDKLDTAQEWLCLIKTRSDRYASVETEVLGLHPYEVPEILAVPFGQGNAAYLRWIDAVLDGKDG